VFGVLFDPEAIRICVVRGFNAARSKARSIAVTIDPRDAGSAANTVGVSNLQSSVVQVDRDRHAPQDGTVRTHVPRVITQQSSYRSVRSRPPDPLFYDRVLQDSASSIGSSILPGFEAHEAGPSRRWAPGANSTKGRHEPKIMALEKLPATAPPEG
jgi:hypothetical protein